MPSYEYGVKLMNLLKKESFSLEVIPIGLLDHRSQLVNCLERSNNLFDVLIHCIEHHLQCNHRFVASYSQFICKLRRGCVKGDNHSCLFILFISSLYRLIALVGICDVYTVALNQIMGVNKKKKVSFLGLIEYRKNHKRGMLTVKRD